jgi:predicted DNA-binding protein (UPF0278 family)
MARKKITDLLGEELTESESFTSSDVMDNLLIISAATTDPENPSLTATEVQTFNAPENKSTVLTESVINKVPKYLTLERKEVRLPSAHIDELTRLVRRLNRQRKGKDERITENTLIRIAVSLLADFGEKIEGNNENELLESLRKVIRER